MSASIDPPSFHVARGSSSMTLKMRRPTSCPPPAHPRLSPRHARAHARARAAGARTHPNSSDRRLNN
eukprot:5173312-Pyramimonas_sp.AAC.1